MYFEDFKVPALGNNAQIDIEDGYDPNLFKQKYLENKSNFVVLIDEKGINNSQDKKV